MPCLVQQHDVVHVVAGIATYGFAPVSLKPEEPFAELYHAPNERISVEGLLAGATWLMDVVTLLAAK